jgi:hypothetical protein
MGILLLGKPAFPFNDSLIQGAPQPSGGDFPFVNHFKNGQGWSGSGFWSDPNTLDDNGWPNTLPGTLTNLFYVPTQAERPGKYFIDWQGNGTLTLGGGAATLDPGYSLTSTTGSGLARVTMADGLNAMSVAISAITDKITDIRVYHEDDADIIDTEIFSPKLVEYARKFGVIRYMDVHITGRSSGMGNLTTWASRKPLSYAFWAAPERKKSISHGTASYALNGSSNDYSKTYGDGVSGPVDKETIILFINNTSTNTTQTFNKNGTGALPILRSDGSANTSGSKLLSGTYAFLMYDAAFNAWMQWAGNSNDGSQYLLNGWPFEVFMELCKKAGAHPLITFCHTVFDPITDYPATLAAYIKENYQDADCPWMVPRFEPANELWNNAFIQTGYADARQRIRNGSTSALTVTAFSYTGSGASGTSTITATGGSVYPVGAALFASGFGGITQFNDFTVYVTETNVGGNPDTFKVNRAPSSGTWTSGGTVQGQANDRHNWYGRALSELGQAIAGAYGVAQADVKTQPYYEIICCVQTSSTPSASDERLLATNYVLTGGSAAKNWATMIGLAQYISPDNRGKPSELGQAWLYNQGDTTQANAYVDGLAGSSATPTTLGYVDNLNAAWKTWAQGHGIQKACGYEGGYSPDYLASGATVSCTITGATKDATGCTLTVSNGSIEPGWVSATTNANGCFDSDCAGLTFTIASVAGMTQLNGLTATIVSVTGNQVKTNIDSSGFSTYTSGGIATVVNGRTLINALRYAGKNASNLKSHTKTNWQNFVDRSDVTYTAEFPSGFIWTGSSFRTNLASPGVAGDGQVWSIRDPSIYADTSPQTNALDEFNAGI